MDVFVRRVCVLADNWADWLCYVFYKALVFDDFQSLPQNLVSYAPPPPKYNLVEFLPRFLFFVLK